MAENINPIEQDDAKQRLDHAEKRDEPGKQAKSAENDRVSATKARVLDAAEALICERPMADITMEAIAAKAGAGKQTLYRHWPSKVALYVDAYKRIFGTARATGASGTSTTSEDTGQSGKDALYSLLRHAFRKYRETPAADILAGLISQAQADPKAKAALVGGLVMGRRGLLTDPLRRMVQEGDLPEGFDIVGAADLIVAQIWHRLLLGERRFDRAELEVILARAFGGAEGRLGRFAGGAAQTERLNKSSDESPA